MQLICIYSMKISFVGKGGSGKTSLSSLLSRFLASRGHQVLAIDGDINQHMGRSLSGGDTLQASLPPMGIEADTIKEYLRGINPLIPSARTMIKTTPPGRGSQILSLAKDNPIFKRFSHIIEGVRFMAVGSFNEEDIGTRCYHSKTGVIELLLNHIVDTKNEYVIVDMTAGADAFASGLFTRFDLTVLVVEPTVKSVDVFHQYRTYAKDHNITLVVVGNKIESPEDQAFIKESVGDAYLVGFPSSAFIKKTDRGEHFALSHLTKSEQSALAVIQAHADAQQKDWGTYLSVAQKFHKKNAESWGSDSAGTDLTRQIDPEFSYPQQ
jgi:CO dehydrogenase maturation factor